MSRFGFISSVFPLWMKCSFHSGKETRIFFQGLFCKLFPQQLGTGVIRKKEYCWERFTTEEGKV